MNLSFVTDYWEWLKRKGYKSEDCGNRELLHEFYYSDFHPKNPNYEVNGLEYFLALGKL